MIEPDRGAQAVRFGVAFLREARECEDGDFSEALELFESIEDRNAAMAGAGIVFAGILGATRRDGGDETRALINALIDRAIEHGDSMVMNWAA